MILYLVRHGIAVEPAGAGPRADFARPLSPEGRRKSESAAQGLRRMACAPELVVSSPLPRALETAEIIARVLAVSGAVRTLAVLKPEAPVEHALAWIRAQSAQSILVVGHMPGIAGLASRALSGSGRVDLQFRKSAACCLSLSPGSGQLVWHLQPRQLRLLGKT